MPFSEYTRIGELLVWAIWNGRAASCVCNVYARVGVRDELDVRIVPGLVAVPVWFWTGVSLVRYILSAPVGK